jgi:hypothetical protein
VSTDCAIFLIFATSLATHVRPAPRALLARASLP